jgi:hypothetical protein
MDGWPLEANARLFLIGAYFGQRMELFFDANKLGL